MDQADMPHALASQEVRLGQHDELIRRLLNNKTRSLQNVADLTHQISPISAQVFTLAAASTQNNRAAPATAALHDFHACDPEPSEGRLGKRHEFLLQRCLVFEQQPQSFASGAAKVNCLSRCGVCLSDPDW